MTNKIDVLVDHDQKENKHDQKENIVLEWVKAVIRWDTLQDTQVGYPADKNTPKFNKIDSNTTVKNVTLPCFQINVTCNS